MNRKRHSMRHIVAGVFIIVIGFLASTFSVDAKDQHKNEQMTSTKAVKNGFKLEQKQLKQQQLFQRLHSRAMISPTPGLSVLLSDNEKASINQNKGSVQRKGIEFKQQVGLVRDINKEVSFTQFQTAQFNSASQKFAVGMMHRKGGAYTWTATINAIDASAMRIHFAGFSLPDDAKLYIFNNSGQAFGPYSGRGRNNSGQFWSHTVFGDTLHLQIEFGSLSSEKDIQATRFVIAGVGYIGSKFKLLDLWSQCESVASCVVAADNQQGDGVSAAKKAVGHMQYVSGRYIYICSGGLIADVPDSGRNYFLTANHCVSKGGEANSLETYFFFQSCGNGSAPPSVLGASILSTNRSSDYTLLELNGSLPTGTVRLGWDATPVAFNDGEMLYRISHPQGYKQAYSQHNVDTDKGTCRSWPRGDWIYSKDIVGATQGGSSGSPVLNSQGRIVGQLSGACGYDLENECAVDANATVDGAFAAYFSRISQWLAPSGVPDPDPDPEPEPEQMVEVGLSASSEPARRNRWTAIVDVQLTPVVAGALVSGQWSGSAKGSSSCTTNAQGRCSLEKSNIRAEQNAVLSISSVEHPDYGYADSDSITISPPTSN
ncbi:serine protease [Thalassotalea sp. HSM 43]|nr:serine protease [Thalassotalea sp. HSM 43]